MLLLFLVDVWGIWEKRVLWEWVSKLIATEQKTQSNWKFNLKCYNGVSHAKKKIGLVVFEGITEYIAYLIVLSFKTFMNILTWLIIKMK